MFRFYLFLSVLFSLFQLSSREDEVYFQELLERANIYENSEVRSRVLDKFNESIDKVLSLEEQIYPQRTSVPVKFGIDINTNDPTGVYYTFRNRFKANDNYSYPLVGKGNYIIRRDIKTGKISEFKIFYQESLDKGRGESVIQFLRDPDHIESVYMNIVLFGDTLYKDIQVPFSLEKIIDLPLSELLSLTSDQVMWEMFFIDHNLKEWLFVRQIPDKVRPYLEKIEEVYDGVMDRNGYAVKILNGESLNTIGFNCSGFAKWVTDGVYMELNPTDVSYMDVRDLKEKKLITRGDTNSWNRAKEFGRDPYFGLDWTRNIAKKLGELRVGHSIDTRARDLDNVPFFKYLDNVGYSINNLWSLLYLSTTNNPGNFYIGTINGNFGNPPLHQYYHVVLIFPYFDEKGNFQVNVMETGEETSVSSLMSRFMGEYIHLSLIQAPTSYFIPALPIKREEEEILLSLKK